MSKPFKIGDRIAPCERWHGYKYVDNVWKKTELRPYMIITNFDEFGWFQTDNQNFNLEGGHWNPDAFELVASTPILEEDLFCL